MRWSVVGLVLVGLIGAICAAILAASLRSAGSRTQVASPRDNSYVVARVDLEPMSVIRADDVRLEKSTEGTPPPGSFPNASHVIGKVLAARVMAGQALTRPCFVTEGSGPQLAAIVGEGKRAVTLSLHDYSGLEGLLYPGSIVDVLVSLNKSSSSDAVSTTLLERVLVLAVNRQTVFSEEGADTSKSRQSSRFLVTLMVTAEQAQAIQLSTQHGVISLALRNPADVGSGAARPTAISDLSSKNTLRRLNRAQAPGKEGEWETVIIRGSDVETQHFAATVSNL